MASAAVQRPHAHLTRVFEGEARHVAYDFVENDAVDPAAMVAAMGAATAIDVARWPRVYVASDGTSVSVTDDARTKATGRLGTLASGGRGDKVHGALAIDPAGAVAGVLDLQFWQRTGASTKARRAVLPTAAKETQRWLDARQHARERLAAHAPETRPHFLHDREADAWPILLDAHAHRATEDTTLRASWNRRVVPDAAGDDERPHVREVLAATPLCGRYALAVSAGPARTARTAAMEVRAAAVTLQLRDKQTGDLHAVRLHVVQAVEVGTTPAREKPIEWLLYTTRVVETFADATETVREYAYRWRIEEFHRAWKSGGTQAESTQLSGANRVRWLIILAAVAARAVRLSYRSRTTPEGDPAEEFEPQEIEIVGALQAASARRPPPPLTLATMVRTIATLGGWVRQKSNPNPGPQTLLLGLIRLSDIVLGANMAAGRSPATSQRSRQ